MNENGLYLVIVCIVFLIIGGEEWDSNLSNRVEFGMSCVLGIVKVFDLSHGELADSEETLARSDLVSEALTDLSTCEWHFAIVEL